MQITYETNIDHWIASQIFSTEQLTSLKKHDKKVFAKSLIYLILFDVLIYLNGGVSGMFWFFTCLIVVLGAMILLPRVAATRKLLFKRLQVAFGPEFEKEPNKTVVWDVGPELFIIRDYCKETRFSWIAVDKIVVCPNYLFVHLGITGWAWLCKQAVTESEYHAFCEYFIQAYQQHATQHKKPVEIIHSDWKIDIDNLKAKAKCQCSVKKIIFTVIWAFVFLVIGTLFSALILAVAITVESSTDVLTFENRQLSDVLAMPLGIGTLLLLVLGAVLGLFGKLPGTRNSNG